MLWHPPCWQAAPPIKCTLHAESRGSEQLQGRSSPLWCKDYAERFAEYNCEHEWSSGCRSFNLTVQTPLNAALTNINTTTQPTLQQYLVNNKGEIDFPVIGRLKVGGLTKTRRKIWSVSNCSPIWKRVLSLQSVWQITKFRYWERWTVRVLYRRKWKGKYPWSPCHGGRYDCLWRPWQCETDSWRCKGKREIINLNLNNAELVVSPYYYLRQNDIIYVTPNKTKPRTRTLAAAPACGSVLHPFGISCKPSGNHLEIKLINIIVDYKLLIWLTNRRTPLRVPSNVRRTLIFMPCF